MPECTVCGEDYDTLRGMRTHRGRMHKDWLREQIKPRYIDQMMTPREIAGELDMARKTVDRWVREFDLSGKQPARFELEPDYAGQLSDYPMWNYTGCGERVRVHRLQAIAAGYDPHRVFSGDYDVHHVNGCHLDNREENLELVEKGPHGAADGSKSECGYTHKDYLRALVSDPPEWAQNVVDDAEY